VRRSDLVVFLGPSLPANAALRIAPCTVLPPARQGDVWRALEHAPRAIALVDGLFESEPSVWHREILDALAAGVAVFGGASMGALRAAELWQFGMVGVGEIFAAYRDGRLLDDGEVALLHAGPEHGYRAFTVPLVNVRAAAAGAVAAGALSRGEAHALVDLAERTFYMDRTWKTLLARIESRWSRGARSRWDGFAAAGLPDVKASDARATLAAAAAFARSAAAVQLPASAPRPASSLVRRRKLAGAARKAALPAATGVRGAALAEDGLRRALLAGLARSLGLAPSASDVARAEARWLRERRVPRRGRARFLTRMGMDEVDAARLAEDLALERLLLEEPSRVVPDGPSEIEGLAAEARRLGLAAGRQDGARRRRIR